MHRVIERVYTLRVNIAGFISGCRNRPALKLAKDLNYNLSKRFPNDGADNETRRLANYLAPQYKGLHLRKINLSPQNQIPKIKYM